MDESGFRRIAIGLAVANAAAVSTLGFAVLKLKGLETAIAILALGGALAALTLAAAAHYADAWPCLMGGSAIMIALAFALLGGLWGGVVEGGLRSGLAGVAVLSVATLVFTEMYLVERKKRVGPKPAHA